MTDRKGSGYLVGIGRRGHMGVASVCTLAVLAGALAGCNREKRKQPPPRPRQAEQIVLRQVPSALRGTVGAEASLQGVESTLVSGIGFVVGLNGTGGLTMPEQFAAHLEREMGLKGITASSDAGGSALAGRSPRQLLQDPNTAAVIVQAAVPPGANNGDSFDVYVRAINATSLEGGTLWTTTLRVGPPSAFGNRQAIEMGNAKGPIFLNPFASPGGGDGLQRTVGRVLDGGAVSEPTVINVVLDNPSHQRARQIASAINSSFPRGPGDADQIARGRDDQLVQVRVPFRYRDRREDFIELIRHMPIDQSFPEAFARRFAQTLRTDPYLSKNMSFSLEAVGERAKPFLTDLYDSGELGPRLAALRAGASLDDPRAVRSLRDIALNGPDSLRADAIALMASIDGGPIIDEALRSLLSSDQMAVRVEAYEGLMTRAVSLQKRRLALAQQQAQRMREVVPSASPTQLDTLARAFIPGGGLQGVSRELVEGKFFLDRVPFGEPLIYITQQGEPRIVLFGRAAALRTPMLVSAWEGRLLMASDAPGDPVRLYYRDPVTRRTTTLDSVPMELEALIRFMAKEPTPNDPRPGLGLGYAEIVGLLYQIQQGSATQAAFATEADRLLLRLLQTVEQDDIEIRPESPGGEVTLVSADDPRREVVERDESGLVRERRSLLVPLNQPQTPEGGGAADGGSKPRSEPTPSKTVPMRSE